jgi:ethanolamine utilization protein EutP (predicted NTPase)
MELLKGSEKQKAWATQIITDARNTIARNIALANERKAQYPTEAAMFDEEIAIWEDLQRQYEAIITPITDAAVIIDKRNMLDASAVMGYFSAMFNMRQIARHDANRSA